MARPGLFKPLYFLYYGLLYGRSYPFAARLERRVRAWERATGRGDAPAPREDWDDQYAAGRWDVMHEPDELPRYRAVAGFLRALRPGAQVLDVGCGDGNLIEHLGGLELAGYTGVDLSRTAVERARARNAGEGIELVVADAERWEPLGGNEVRYDAIVLNESLYYFEQPLEGALRWRRWLAEDGILIVSSFRTRRSDAIRRRLLAAWPARDEATIRGPKGTWVVTAHRAADAPAEPARTAPR